MQTPISGSIDLSLYLSSPSFSVQEGVTLARALIAACPKKVSVVIKRAAAKLARVADTAQTAISARQRENNQLSEEDSRELDQEVDALFRGMRWRLEGYTCLSPRHVPRSLRAAQLSEQLFGSAGLIFLSDSYAAQLTTMQALLQRITEDRLDQEIDALCGPEFLVRLRLLLPRYQRMVQTSLSRRSGTAESLLTHRHALSRAVLAYATAVCTLIDEDQPETTALVVTALLPIEGQRAAMASRRNTSAETAADDEADPAGTTPPAPGAAPAPSSD